MSILQEYDFIRKSLKQEVNEGVNLYLQQHPEILLFDVYYTPEGWNKFQDWFQQYRYNKLLKDCRKL